ncbi:APC family permease [Nocardioides guangzhouensis]|uniref:APC family permease n=1 Tax=Nocardioides guangzhouensis TaxID=2497878 RepID=UPI001C376D34|nr:APC family permease [Nocardioides guangzhouensis]
MTKQGGLSRSLGLWAIVGLGLGYMTPTVLFDTFGIVTEETNGVVPLTYLMALVVMVFTAISYGRMAKVFPTAGSSYTYTREAMHPRLGFLVGWAALLDYLLLPLVNALIIRLYMTSLFPSVPGWIWVVGFVAGITALNAWSMKSTSKLNFVLVAFAVAMIGAFLVLATVQLYHGMGQGTLFTTQPFFHSGVAIPAVLSGATVVCFSFIGFDAITMYAEEARRKSDVAKAIIITLLIGGAIFLVTGHVAQAIFPDVAGFQLVDDTLPEMALKVGGGFFQIVFMSAAFAATVASALASHASVSRMLHVMGRNGVLPKRIFATVHPRRHTPVGSVIVVGLVSLLAITPSLELISSMINFGALVAFTFVNLSVLAYFAWRRREYRTPKHVATNVVLPLIGTLMTGVLWSFLHKDALIAGIVWVSIGVIYAVALTRFTGRRVSDVAIGEEAAVVTAAPEPELAAV